MTSHRSCCCALVLMLLHAASAAGAGVVITQVYGGGGNTGAPYDHDYVELFNNTGSAVPLLGWSIQYASGTGTSWQVTNLTGSIAAGYYFLVEESGGASSGVSLPTPDLSGTINFSATSGKIALVRSASALQGNCPDLSVLADFVGYGTADCYEGSGPAAAASNTKSVTRVSGCYDTDDNALDFTIATPNPRNSQTPGVCANPVAIDFAVLQFPNSTTATACQAPASGTVIYGRVYIAGVTGVGTPVSGLVAEVGVGPSASDPASEPTWEWARAAYNAACGGCGNDDEYQGTIPSVHSSGTFAYAYRFSYQGGAYVYADLSPGTTDGYQVNDAGQLTVDGNDIFCSPFDRDTNP